MIELRQLLYLNTVHESKNFTKASKLLYVSQPTISASIKSLENQLGIKLIDRTSKEVVFTPAGERIIRHTQRIMSEYEDLISEANDMSKLQNTTIRLGIASILSENIFPIIYKEFLPDHRDIIIRLDEDSALGQIQKLIDGDLDLALNGLPEDGEIKTEIITIPICKREIKVVMHKDHHLSALNEIPYSMLNNEPISTMTSLGVMGQILGKKFKEHNLNLNIMSEHSQMMGMFEMVHTGCSIGFMNLYPEESKISKYDDLVVRSLEEPLIFDIGFMVKKHKYLSNACRDFIDFIASSMQKERLTRKE